MTENEKMIYGSHLIDWADGWSYCMDCNTAGASLYRVTCSK